MKLPPWKACCERDKREMMEWCHVELVALNYGCDDQNRWGLLQHLSVTLEQAIASARSGNMKPLRRMYPELAEFLHEPKRKPGQRRPYQNKNAFEKWPHELAVDDVRQLREVIWPNYYGRAKRHSSDGDSAEKIAGALYSLTEDEVLRAMKQH